MKIKDVMSKEIQWVHESDNVMKAAQQMKENNIGPIPVIQDHQPVGVLTDRDIVVRLVAEGRDAARTKVGEIMTREIVTCYEDQEVADAAALMGDRQVRRLLVIDSRKNLAGIVSIGDIANQTGDKTLVGGALEEISQADAQGKSRNLYAPPVREGSIADTE